MSPTLRSYRVRAALRSIETELDFRFPKRVPVRRVYTWRGKGL